MPRPEEEGTVGRCVRRALHWFAGRGTPGEAIVVENGSKDRSAERAAETEAQSGSILFGLQRLLTSHPIILDLAFIAVLMAAAALPRLIFLGNIPAGIHGDEAQVGTDARRVLEEGWIGPYVTSALGQPAGHAYLTAPAIKFLGSTPFSLRLPLALVGVAAVPLLYLLLRVLLSRDVALIGGMLLALSLWHIHYSRVAHWAISYPTVGLVALLFFALGIKRGRWYYFALGGLAAGLGVYTYNIYPAFLAALALWIAALTVLRYRSRLFPWGVSLGITAVAFVVVAAPMLDYLSDTDATYYQHVRGYSKQNVLRSDEFQEASLPDKISLAAGQAKSFLRAYVWEGRADLVDGAGLQPMLDPLTVALVVLGLAYALPRWREPPYLLALVMLVVLPLPAVFAKEGVYRAPLGVAPFLAMFSAVPLALVWRWGRRSGGFRCLFTSALVVAAIAVIGVVGVSHYFRSAPYSDLMKRVYYPEMTAASTYMRDLPGRPYVYFLASRAPLDHPTRRYLAPEVEGEIRSEEFSQHGFDLSLDVEGRDVVFILMDRYLGVLLELSRLYPAGEAWADVRDGETAFISYYLPREEIPP